MSDIPEGWIKCGACNGSGRYIERYGKKPGALPPGVYPCVECEGNGIVKCEHWEYGDHNDCLDCGYDRTPDLMDAEKTRRETD